MVCTTAPASPGCPRWKWAAVIGPLRPLCVIPAPPIRAGRW